MANPAWWMFCCMASAGPNMLQLSSAASSTVSDYHNAEGKGVMHDMRTNDLQRLRGGREGWGMSHTPSVLQYPQFSL